MSASTHPPQPLRFRRPRVDELLASGWTPLAAVTLSGLTLGFFAWYALLVPLHNAGISQIGLIAAVPCGAAVAIAAWFEYARYFSRRAGTTLARSLQYDALAWVPFLLLWLTFTLPPGITHGARLLLVAGSLFCIVKVLIAARFNQTVREVLLDFVATRAAIIVIAELAALIIGQRAGTHVQESRHMLLAVWGRWDAVHYIDIATKGYQGTDMAFFPLYPFLIRIVGAFAGNHLVAGLLISNASFFFGLLFLYKLLEHEYDRPVARRAIFYASIFPSAVFFSAVYTESLFFILTVA
ncbi:MAG: mannosyltransferase family protein [Candidatus Tumulicola sp.]